MCFFSVIIPCYNVAEHIEKSIQSIFSQTFTSYELLLINDGSSDNTSDVLNKFSKHSNLFIFNNHTNRGVSYSRNKGVSKSKGKYLIFLDGDDVFEKALLSDLFDFIAENNGIDIVSFGYQIILGRKIIRASSEMHNRKVFSSKQFLKLFLHRQLRQHLCSMAIKTELIKANQIYFNENTYAGEDQEFQILAMLYAKTIGYLSKEYFYYIARDNSVMNIAFNIKRVTSIDAMNRISLCFDSRVELRKLFVNYATLEVFSVLKYAKKAEREDYINIILEKAEPILNDKVQWYFKKNSMVIYFLKTLFNSNKKVFLQLLNKI